MALKKAVYGQANAVSFTYTVDGNLDFGNVPLNIDFLNLHDNIIYHKDSKGAITRVGSYADLTVAQKTLVAGANISITENSEEIIIASTTSGSSNGYFPQGWG